MEDFKKYLSENANEEERAAADLVKDGLDALRRKSTVDAVEELRREWLKKQWRRRFWICFTVLLLGGGACWLWWRQRAVMKEQQQAPAGWQLQDTLPKVKDVPGEIPQSKPPGQKPVQMAQNQTHKQDNNRFPAPNIRGSSMPDPQWQDLLNRIWKTSYPPAAFPIDASMVRADSLLRARDFSAAYVQIQKLERKDPANDGIRYLKGYCLLELGEGPEALRYFEGLETRHEAWAADIEWYRGLAWMLAGDMNQARQQFDLIIHQKDHPFMREAMNALKEIH